MYTIQILDHSNKTYSNLNKTAVTLLDAEHLMTQAYIALWKKFPAAKAERFDIAIMFNGQYVKNAPENVICK